MPHCHQRKLGVKRHSQEAVRGLGMGRAVQGDLVLPSVTRGPCRSPT